MLEFLSGQGKENEASKEKPNRLEENHKVWCQGNTRDIRGAGRRKWPLVPNSAGKLRWGLNRVLHFLVQVLSSDLIKRDFSGVMGGLEVNSGIMKSWWHKRKWTPLLETVFWRNFDMEGWRESITRWGCRIKGECFQMEEAWTCSSANGKESQQSNIQGLSEGKN